MLHCLYVLLDEIVQEPHQEEPHTEELPHNCTSFAVCYTTTHHIYQGFSLSFIFLLSHGRNYLFKTYCSSMSLLCVQKSSGSMLGLFSYVGQNQEVRYKACRTMNEHAYYHGSTMDAEWCLCRIYCICLFVHLQ